MGPSAPRSVERWCNLCRRMQSPRAVFSGGNGGRADTFQAASWVPRSELWGAQHVRNLG